MGVGAADAEGGDAGAARALRLPARAGRSRSSSISPASQSTLEEGASTCRVLGRTPSRIAITILITPATPAAAWVWPMLDLIEPSRSGCLAVLAVGGEQGAGLDRVAEGGAGAVGLDHVDVLGLEAGVGQGLADHPLLGGAVGGGQAVGGAVLVDGASRVSAARTGWPFALGVGEALQDEHADALGEAGAVGGLGEGLAAPVGGEAALAAELGEDRRGWRAPSPRRPAPASTRPLRSACAARCIATSEEEQAVSTVIAGPSRPRV